MAEAFLSGNQFSGALQEILGASDIQPGDQASYQLAKSIFEYHPMGGKLASAPIEMAQSQERKISVPAGPEDKLVEAFNKEWAALGCDDHIKNVAQLARVYGLCSVAMVCEGTPSDRPVDFSALSEASIAFTVADPLNTAGSLLLSQDPNSVLFQKIQSISINSQPYHRSRTTTLLNENPIYLSYTSSSFAYAGRSVYQRALFQLKSFLATLQTDDLIALKAGVIIQKQKQNSSVVDALMQGVGALKREFLKWARTGNVVTIGIDESVEAIDLKNIAEPYSLARKNIIENIASASGTPAKLLLEESFAEGFGEGTEDAKAIAAYISRIRIWMGPLYAYFDKIVRYRAWNRAFYKTIQNEFPEEFDTIGYTKFFYDATNSFVATWPSLIEEPPSERIKVDDVKLKAVIAWVEVMAPMLDPENKALLVQWACDTLNSMPLLFTSPLNLDMEAFANYVPPAPPQMEDAPEPFSARDSVARLSEALARLPDQRRRIRA